MNEIEMNIFLAKADSIREIKENIAELEDCLVEIKEMSSEDVDTIEIVSRAKRYIQCLLPGKVFKRVEFAIRAGIEEEINRLQKILDDTTGDCNSINKEKSE